MCRVLLLIEAPRCENDRNALMSEICCARCGRLGDDKTALPEGWDHDVHTPQEAVLRARGGDTIAWICPDCLTDSERATIAEEAAETSAFLDQLARNQEWS